MCSYSNCFDRTPKKRFVFNNLSSGNKNPSVCSDDKLLLTSSFFTLHFTGLWSGVKNGIGAHNLCISGSQVENVGQKAVQTNTDTMQNAQKKLRQLFRIVRIRQIWVLFFIYRAVLHRRIGVHSYCR